MRILIYQPRASYYTGGGEVVPVKHALYLAQLGHQVIFVTTRANFIHESELINSLKNVVGVTIKYIDVPEKYEMLYNSGQPGDSWERWDRESLYIGLIARDFIKDIEYDLGVSHLLFDTIALQDDKKKVVHLHGFPEKFEYHHKLLAGVSDCYISVSEKISDKWMSILPRTAAKSVVKNGIDTREFKPGKNVKTVDILYVGRIIQVKGIDVLIDAVARSRHTATKVTIAGTGPYQEVLRQDIIDRGLEDWVDLVGYVDQSKLEGLYQSAKIAVFPSLGKEGVLTTMLEAASCGLPVITTSAGSMTEFITNGETGIIVKPNDSKELCDQIDRLLDDKDLRNTIGENARASVLASWSWDRRIRELESIYQGILRG